MPPKKNNDAVVALVTMVVLIGAILGGVLLFRRTSGAAVGEECHDTVACHSGLHCVEHACQPACEATSDCPARMSCQEFEVKKDKLGVEYTVSSFKACVPL
jgi:hypothetical protein